MIAMSANWRREYDDEALLFGLLTGIKPIPDVVPTKSSLPQTGAPNAQVTHKQESKPDAKQSVTHK
ncbi:hypothetical protein FD19_GL000844 [Lacticaseibacillus thailandensis DSM 22698 = JCM 13996]|uniref:Uncharacterized protein n=2 Tax=Lacticaseibacillus thailandensis TaxID=381741 RepID=A0A0R2C7M7_9LACO|nr:hypothetical protein FD19_GL000844 [Lacticaseibacillus thailandensis DSM 22698 = JCM 13996]